MANSTCPHCHAPIINTTAKFCQTCGKSLAAMAVGPAAQTPPLSESLPGLFGKFRKTAETVGRKTYEMFSDISFNPQPYLAGQPSPVLLRTDSGMLTIKINQPHYPRPGYWFFKGLTLDCSNGHHNSDTRNEACPRCGVALQPVWIHEYYPKRTTEIKEQRQYLSNLSRQIPGILPQQFVVVQGTIQIVIAEMTSIRDVPLAVLQQPPLKNNEIMPYIKQVGEIIAKLHAQQVTFFDKAVFRGNPFEPLGLLANRKAAIIDLAGCNWTTTGAPVNPGPDIAYLGLLLFRLAVDQNEPKRALIQTAQLDWHVKTAVEQAIYHPETFSSIKAFLQALNAPTSQARLTPQTRPSPQARPQPAASNHQLPSQPSTTPIVQRSLRQNAGYSTHPGKVREHNEDFVGRYSLGMDQNADTSEIGLYLVADGMGGHQAGELASRAVNEVIINQIQANQAALQTGTRINRATINLDELLIPSEVLRAAIQQGNTVLLQGRQKVGGDRGTTITAALVIGNKAYIANVGDSRTYLMRQGKLAQVTRDHSVVDALVRSGQVRPEDVRSHPQRNQIYRTMGDQPNVEIDLFTQELVAGDRLLLCSDGLWEMVLDPQIEQILLQAPTPQRACDQLIQAANQAGGEDNVTAIVVVVE